MGPAETVILLAEDEPVVRNLVRLMLSREGYAVLAANDGREALDLAIAFKDPIHLLLTDVRMPRMNGLTLIENIKTARPDIKTITMSGETATIIARENASDAFLRKPFVPPTLLKCVQHVLERGYSGSCETI